MKKSLYSTLPVLVATSVALLCGISAAQAQILQLSPVVHAAPPGGYSFHALAPLPTMMSDRVDIQLMGNGTGSGSITAPVRPAFQPAEPTTVLELKKKP